MKLRIKDNSIRLRLSQSEVDHLQRMKMIKSEAHFGGGNVLTYGLKSSAFQDLNVHFEGGEIFVEVPEDIVENWCSTDLVGFDAVVSVGDGQTLLILIEKDFKCLTDRTHEDESDLFPNPRESH